MFYFWKRTISLPPCLPASLMDSAYQYLIPLLTLGKTFSGYKNVAFTMSFCSILCPLKFLWINQERQPQLGSSLATGVHHALCWLSPGVSNLFSTWKLTRATTCQWGFLSPRKNVWRGVSCSHFLGKTMVQACVIVWSTWAMKPRSTRLNKRWRPFISFLSYGNSVRWICIQITCLD